VAVVPATAELTGGSASDRRGFAARDVRAVRAARDVGGVRDASAGRRNNMNVRTLSLFQQQPYVHVAASPAAS